MGLEATCRAHAGRKSGDGKAQLETDTLLFRGEFRLDIPLAKVTRAEARDGILEVRYGRTTARFELGKLAPKWADKITNPKELIDKLGVKANSRVSVIGIEDAAFWKQLEARTPDITRGKLAKDSDFIFAGLTKVTDLNHLPKYKKHLKPNGAIWGVWAKGKAQPVSQFDVMAASRLAELVDTKVCSFSETHTALKMVIPADQR